MDSKIKLIMDSCPSAMIYLQGNRIEYANALACELMGTQLCGRTASYAFPDRFIDPKEKSYTTAMTLRGKRCSVCVERMDEDTMVSITPEPANGSELVTAPLLDSLTAALCNMNLSMKIISEKFGAGSEDMDEYLSILYHNYYIAKRTVGNLRSASELRHGNMAFLPVVADLALLCSDLVSSVSVMLSPEMKVSFTTDIGELPVRMDPDYIERLLLNIIANSCEASGQAGEINVTLSRQGGRAVITITDKGCGMDADALRHVFNAYEGKERAAEASGSGLGLNVAKGIAELHGGSIMVSGAAGRGTKVTVTLPIDGGILESPTLRTTDSRSMDTILTELSGVLRSDSYTESFRD